MTVERPVVQPLAVLEGSRTLEVLSAPLLVLLAIPLGIFAVLFLAAVVGPSNPPPSLGPLGLPSWSALLVLAPLGASVGAVLLGRYVAARTGRVEVFADRVALGGGRQARCVFFADLDAFSDDSSDYVLLRRDGAITERIRATVPTPPRSNRAALLDALVQAGVPRRDGARTPRAPLPALLVADGGQRRAETLATLATLLVLLALALAERGALASSSLHSVARLLDGPQVYLLFVPALVTWVALAKRRGHVTFRADRVELTAAWLGPPIAVAWEDLVGWRATSTDHLLLGVREGVLKVGLLEPTVPTPTPALRAAIEALLTERGVPCL